MLHATVCMITPLPCHRFTYAYDQERTRHLNRTTHPQTFNPTPPHLPAPLRFTYAYDQEWVAHRGDVPVIEEEEELDMDDPANAIFSPGPSAGGAPGITSIAEFAVSPSFAERPSRTSNFRCGVLLPSPVPCETFSQAGERGRWAVGGEGLCCSLWHCHAAHRQRACPTLSLIARSDLGGASIAGRVKSVSCKPLLEVQRELSNFAWDRTNPSFCVNRSGGVGGLFGGAWLDGCDGWAGGENRGGEGMASGGTRGTPKHEAFMVRA